MNIKNLSVIKSYYLLKGNTKLCVMFYPLFAIPFSLFNFYMGLYMKAQGLSGKQMGYIISINFIFSAIASFFGASMVNKLVRKRSALLIDAIA